MGCKLGNKVPNIYSYMWKGRQLLFIVNSAKIAFYNFIFTIIKIPLDILTLLAFYYKDTRLEIIWEQF